MTARERAAYSGPVRDCMREYLPAWRDLATSAPALAFAAPLAEALAVGARPGESGGPLRAGLHAAGMRCALGACAARTCADGSALRLCAGPCRGLARYCGREHQVRPDSAAAGRPRVRTRSEGARGGLGAACGFRLTR